jgi:hypothetical protein
MLIRARRALIPLALAGVLIALELPISGPSAQTRPREAQPRRGAKTEQEPPRGAEAFAWKLAGKKGCVGPGDRNQYELTTGVRYPERGKSGYPPYCEGDRTDVPTWR